MSSICRLALPAALAFVSSTATLAAEPAPAASAGPANDWLRQQGELFKDWDLGGQFRARFEDKEHFAIAGSPGSMDFRGHGADTDNTYGLFRTKVHVGYAPTDWARILVEGRDSFEWGDDRTPDPESDRTDLHQAYVQLGNPKEFPLGIKVGRQELSYGDERLIGAFDWNNLGRVFDAAKLRFENKEVWVDAFAGRVIIPRDGSFNIANDYDWFSGVYASSRTLCPFQETQVYFLARNTGDGSPTTLGTGLPAILNGASPRDIYTVGTRIKSLPGKLNGWDYSLEAAGQFGRFKDTVTGPSLEQRAFAAHVAGGYTFADKPATPRLGLEYDFSSGDSNAADGRHGTFENLFPTNHRFYGYMDFISWQNIHNLRAATSARPCKPVLITLDWHAFWLADTHDSFYQANGARRTGQSAGPGTGYGINPNFDSFVGQEVDLIATWTVTSYLTGQAGYGHFFPGEYVRQSLSAPGFGSAGADYIYAQATINF